MYNGIIAASVNIYQIKIVAAHTKVNEIVVQDTSATFEYKQKRGLTAIALQIEVLPNINIYY